MMRWVFIRPRNKSPYYDPEIQEPLGLEYLAASRLEKGDSALVLDCSLDGLTDVRAARRAVSFQPSVIGLSIMTVNELESVHAIYLEAHRVLQGRPVIWLAGGNFVSTESQAGLDLLPGELIPVRFEGERALDHIERSFDPGSGLLQSPDGLARTNAALSGEAVADIDSLPFPVRPFADLINARGWAFNLQGSRGCCGTCRYCASPGMFGAHGPRWRSRSPDRVAEEMSWLNRSYGASSFNFVDEDFLGPPHLAGRRAIEFAQALRKRNLNISFGIQVRPGTLDDGVIDLLVSVGLIYVFMGIESDDPEDFKRWRRGWVADPWRLVRRLKQSGVGVNAGVMLFHSHSTLEGIRSFSRKLMEHGLLDHRSATNRLDAMPASEMYHSAIRDGLFSHDAYGPQRLPFVRPELESLYQDLKAAVDPLGPTSMHALCSLPPLLARSRLNPGVKPELERLRAVIALHDDAVAESLFALLDAYDGRAALGGLVSDLRRKNLARAEDVARKLVAQAFAPSLDELRDAIRMDSGC